MLRCGVHIRRRQAAGRGHVAWGGLGSTWGLYYHLPPLPSQHPHKAIVLSANQNMTTDVRQLWRIENICICWTGKFSLRLGAKEEPEGRRLHWIPDTRKKQWIPFDVNRKFVLLTTMNKYGFWGQGPTGRTKGTSKGDDFATRDKSNTFFLTPDNWLQNHYHLWINECLSASPKWRQSLETLGLDMRIWQQLQLQVFLSLWRFLNSS